MGISLDELQASIDEEKQSNFDKLHSQELVNIGKNFTADEQADVCKAISSRIMEEELQRRFEVLNGILEAVVEKAQTYSRTMPLTNKEELLAEIRQIVRA